MEYTTEQRDYSILRKRNRTISKSWDGFIVIRTGYNFKLKIDEEAGQ